MKIVAVVGTKDAFPRLADALVRWVEGAEERAVWIQHGDEATPRGLAGATMVPRAELIAQMSAADVVVCHGGSGTIGDALELGHTPVVVPRLARLGEHVNDHQLELIDALGDRIIGVRELADLDEAIARAATRRKTDGGPRGAALVAAIRDELSSVARIPTPRRAGVAWSVLTALTRWVPRRRL